MTKQEIFNKVWDHFIVNKGKRSEDSINCRYRDGIGNKCAVGILIPDEMYCDGMEGHNYEILSHKYPLVEVHFGSYNKKLLIDLQHVHDTQQYWDVDTLRTAPLEKVARKYKLTIPQIKQKETTNEKKLTIDHSNYNLPRLVCHG